MRATVPEFLHGGGEMGQRMRSFDWSATPLGEPATWPQSLKTIVRVMLDSRFAMWMAWGSQGTFFCNDAYLPTVGIKRDWVLGARADRVWQEIWHDIGPRIEYVLATGQATWDEGLQLFLRRSGYDEETFHTFSYSPVYDDASQVAGMLCVVVEDTERVIHQRRLALLRDLSARSTGEASSLAGVGALMLGVLASGRFDMPFAALYLPLPQNEGLQLVGATAAPRRGQLPPRVTSDQGGVIGAALWAALAGGEERELTGLLGTVELEGPWPEPLQDALVVPLAGGAQQAPLGCLVVGLSTRRKFDPAYRSFVGLVVDQFTSKLSDADSRFQAEQRAAALAELDRAKNLFFNNVSHEFRTPLTLMLGPVESLLARDELADELRDDLEMLRQNGLRLRRLVNSLLDFSRIEAGRAETHFQPTDLAELTADLASVFRSAVEGAGLRFVVRCQALPEAAYVDRDMWEKVVLNLLSNALKFTFEGAIEVALGAVDGQAQLTVRDSGVGIEASALPKLFDRFYRIEGVRSRSQEGSGIGLALVKELVRLHGGSVAVASHAGVGTTFTVLLPLGKAHLPGERIEAAPAPRPASADRSAFVDDALRGQRSSYRHAAPLPVAASGQGRRRILVVDDNADMRAYMQRILEPVGDVLTAADGELAWGLIRSSLPHLVVSDMMMPQLDGYGLIQRIRSNPETQTLPVIMLSARAGEEARVEGLNQGADDYLVKPFSAAELRARVEVQLLRATLRQAEDLRNKRLADIFRSAPVGVAVTRGPAHVFEFVNPVYEAFIHGRAVLGLPLREALPEMADQGLLELLDQVYASGQPYRGHAVPVQLLDPASGQLQQRHFEFVYQPLPSEEQLVSGIAVICIDVDDVVKSRAAAEAASRSKDEFIAMLGHELRNPLAPIFTALQVMAMREPRALAAERELIARQAQHMARLVDDLLDVSRISRGNVELKRTVVELSTVVRKALEMSRPLMEGKRQLLSVDVPESGLTLHADPVRLSQVISNVLTNAAKFTGVGGSIQVQGRADGADVMLSVADSGMGMSGPELASVFELFVQGRQGLDRPEGGLGLGLTLARNLARLHGGSLHAASAGPGQGSTFTLRVPAHTVERTDGTPGVAGHGRAAAPQTPPRRVLVVDDNSDAASALAELLGILGHEVVVAEDGPSALDAADSGPPFDVALLDIGLPVMSGYELAQLLRQRSSGRALRLVALTGYGLPADVERSRRSGFDEHLVKPVDVDALLATIRKAEPPNRAA
jgi:signal transduction histidine kinase